MLELHALSKVKVMSISLESIEMMSKRSGPALPAAWRIILLYQVMEINIKLQVIHIIMIFDDIFK